MNGMIFTVRMQILKGIMLYKPEKKEIKASTGIKPVTSATVMHFSSNYQLTHEALMCCEQVTCQGFDFPHGKWMT